MATRPGVQAGDLGEAPYVAADRIGIAERDAKRGDVAARPHAGRRHQLRLAAIMIETIDGREGQVIAIDGEHAGGEAAGLALVLGAAQSGEVAQRAQIAARR